ncbi:hypothetical protein HK101_010978 [Irineochytrium annulatum]|nr:hypothetical protein HK101_010978 [Irineochytrium annulatum]
MSKATLLSSATSPFVRKVRIAIRELQLVDRVVIKESAATPVDKADVIEGGNPLGKVPTLLVSDPPMSLFGSQTITQYLDQQHTSLRVLPPLSDPHRYEVLATESLADGMMEASLLARYETAMRPKEFLWEQWLEIQKGKAMRGVGVLEGRVRGDSLYASDLKPEGGVLDLGTIAVICALGYLDFRHDAWNWRGAAPKLAKWYETLCARPSVAETRPPK